MRGRRRQLGRYVLHNLKTGQDLHAHTEAEALTLTLMLDEGEDWSLWKVDGGGDPTIIAVGSGPANYS